MGHRRLPKSSRGFGQKKLRGDDVCVCCGDLMERGEWVYHLRPLPKAGIPPTRKGYQFSFCSEGCAFMIWKAIHRGGVPVTVYIPEDLEFKTAAEYGSYVFGKRGG